MIKKLLVLGLALLSMSCHAKNGRETKQNNEGINMQEFMNPATWKTYCTGRYLIDLPSGLNPEWAGGDDVYREDIVWQKNITSRKQVIEHIERMKTNLKNLREADTGGVLGERKDGRSYLVKQIDYANGGIGLLAMDTRSGDGMVLYNYFITEKPFRVFYRKVDFVFEQNRHEMIAQEQKLAQSLHSRGEHEVPKGAGLCIYGGFIEGEHTNMRENMGIKLNYPYYSREYYFQIGIGNLVMQEKQNVHPKEQKSNYPKIIKTYRDSFNKTVAGLKGMEYAMLRKSEWDDVPLYNFTWRYPGSGAHNTYDPSVVIFMSYVTHNPGQQKDYPNYLMFANEKEALSLWDKVLQSIKRRPE